MRSGDSIVSDARFLEAASIGIELAPDARMLVTSAEEVARREVGPHAGAIDRERMIPSHLREALGELGFFGLLGSSEPTTDLPTALLVIEEFAAACASTGVMLGIHNLAARNALASTHPGPVIAESLSDGAELVTVADARALLVHEEGEDLVLEGTLRRVPLVRESSFVVLVLPGEEFALLPTGLPGLTLHPVMPTLGLRGVSLTTLAVAGARIPRRHVFRGGALVRLGLELALGAVALGIARGAFHRAVGYSRERKTFGSALAEKQAIQFKLADMGLRIDAARLLLVHSAVDAAGEPSRVAEASRARRFATESATAVTFEALQVYGAYGYSEEYEVERHYRDARAVDLFGRGLDAPADDEGTESMEDGRR